MPISPVGVPQPSSAPPGSNRTRSATRSMDPISSLSTKSNISTVPPALSARRRPPASRPGGLKAAEYTVLSPRSNTTAPVATSITRVVRSAAAGAVNGGLPSMDVQANLPSSSRSDPSGLKALGVVHGGSSWATSNEPICRIEAEPSALRAER